jgi:DNA-binding LytR/AlgR family response regulator
MFVQIHRAVVVNRKAITAALRDDAGRVTLQLRGTNKTVPVSRAFGHLFRAM